MTYFPWDFLQPFSQGCWDNMPQLGGSVNSLLVFRFGSLKSESPDVSKAPLPWMHE